MLACANTALLTVTLLTVSVPVPTFVSTTGTPSEVVCTDCAPKGTLVGLAEPIGDSGAGAKVAVTVFAEESVTWHVPVPEQPEPLQPLKTEPAAAVAVSVTEVPKIKFAAHVAPQSIPAGAEATVPVPVLFTLRVDVVTCACTT